MLVKTSIEKHNKKDAVRVDVQRGTSIPYYPQAKGLSQGERSRPSDSSQPAPHITLTQKGFDILTLI